MKSKKSGKTITEIANEIGIDRQRVYRYVIHHLIDSDKVSDEVMNRKGKMIYCDESMELAIIRHFLSEKSDPTSDESDDKVIDEVMNFERLGDEKNDELKVKSSGEYNVLVNELRSRIESQKEIITHQQRTIDELSESLKRAQTLQAAAEKRYLEIETQVAKSSKMSMQEEPKSEEKHGFFWRLFH